MRFYRHKPAAPEARAIPTRVETPGRCWWSQPRKKEVVSNAVGNAWQSEETLATERSGNENACVNLV